MKKSPSVSTGRNGYGQRSDFSGFPGRCDEQADVGLNRSLGDTHSPMPLAEAAECCGLLPWLGIERHHDDGEPCANCPLVIEPSEPRENPDVMRAARAL